MSPVFPENAEGLIEGARQIIIAKQKASTYEAGERPGAWVKWKVENRETFLIGGYIPGTGGFDELVIGRKEREGLRFAARLKNGFVPATPGRIMESLRGLSIPECLSSIFPSQKPLDGGRA